MRYLNHTSIIIRKNRITFEAIFLFAFLFMWILFGWNTGNADYFNYQHIYKSIDLYGRYKGVEFGYEFVCRIAVAIGLSYNGFLVFYSFIGLSLITSTARKYTNNLSFVFVLYFIYPFLLDIVQIRNFMSMAIIIYATRYLVADTKKDYIKYIIFVILASTFHVSAFFYMIFLLVRIKSRKKLTYVTLAILIIGVPLTSLLPYIVNTLHMERYSIYLSFSTSFYAKVLFVVYLGTSIALTYYGYRGIRKKKYQLELHELDTKIENQIEFAEVVMKINIVILVVYVFILIDVDFIRLYRNILPLNYILFSMTKPKNKITKSAKKFVHSWCVFAFVTLSSFAFIFLRTYQGVVYAIFKNNSIIDFFK